MGCKKNDNRGYKKINNLGEENSFMGCIDGVIGMKRYFDI